MTEPLLEFQPETAGSLAREVNDRSGQHISACYQCRKCAAGCPVAEETGYLTPNRLIRLILLGDREEALNNMLVWKCLSCYTCGTRCPNGIQTARVTETLKKMAKEAHAVPLSARVANFHGTFVDSAVRWGRINEMEFMCVYELKNTAHDLKRGRFKDLFHEHASQAKLALAMLKKGRMHFGFQTSKGRDEIQRLRKKSFEKMRAAEPDNDTQG